MKKIGLLILGLTVLIITPSFRRTNIDLVNLQADKIALACQKIGSYENCYEEQFTDLTQRKDLFFSQKVLYKLWEIDSRTYVCHVIAHRISLAQVRKDPASWRKILNSIDPQSCSGGFYHGILEGHASFDPNFELNGAQIDKLCRDKGSVYSEGSCIHILGHILLVQFNGEISKAIGVCKHISLSSSGQCYSGIFMENMTKQNLSEHGIAKPFNWTKDSLKDMEKVCFQQEGDAANGCWGQMGHMYAAVYNDEPEIVFDACKKAPQKEFSTNCYLYAVAKISVTRDSQSNINSICRVYEGSTFFDTCVGRVISSLLQTSPKFYERGKKFCQSLSSKSQIKCFENLNHKKQSEKL